MKPDARYARHLLEGRVDKRVFEEQKRASSVDWRSDYFCAGGVASAEEDVVFRRHDNTIKFVIPWIERFQTLADAHVIDFGCGCGSSTLALSRFAKRVDGFEIEGHSVEAARTRMRLFGADNVQIHQADPVDIIGLAADKVSDSSVVVLLAVVEHLLEHEQVEYLQTLWRRMKPGQILVIAETPNYYAWFDTHTFQIPFASMVPDALFPEFLKRYPGELRFRHTMLGDPGADDTDQVLKRRRRFGLGVTHHCFEQAFGQDLSEITISDGFDDPIVNWFGVQADDQLLLSGFEVHKVLLPIGFARSVLSFVFRKPRSAEDAAATRRWNAQQRMRVISQHGAFFERRQLRQRIRELEAGVSASDTTLFERLKRRLRPGPGKK